MTALLNPKTWPFMAETDCCGSNRSLTAEIVLYTIFKP